MNLNKLKELRDLIAKNKIENCLEQLMGYLSTSDEELYKSVLIQNSNYNDLKTKVTNNIVTEESASRSRAKICNSLLVIIQDIEKSVKKESEKDFVNEVINEISESAVFEAMAKLFSKSVEFKGELTQVNESKLDEVIMHLWKIFEGLNELKSAMTNLSNFMYAYPELRRLQIILTKLNIDGIDFKFGESLEIHSKGGLIFNVALQGEMIFTGPDGGKLISPRTMFTILKRLLNSSKEISSKVHLDIMVLLEKYPYVAQLVAGNAQKGWASNESGYSVYQDTLLSKLQHLRQKEVSDVINELMNWVDSEPGYFSAFDNDLEASGRFYGSLELCKAMSIAIQKVLAKPSLLIKKV